MVTFFENVATSLSQLAPAVVSALSRMLHTLPHRSMLGHSEAGNCTVPGCKQGVGQAGGREIDEQHADSG